MGHAHINRETAKRAAAGARVGAIALALCGGAVAVFGVPFVRVESEPIAATPVTDETTQAAPPKVEQVVDAGGIAMRLTSVSNAPKPVLQAAEEQPLTEVDGESTDPVAAPSDEVAFLGLIREPGRTLALIRVNGRQTVMWEGRVVDGLTLVGVGDDSVQVEREGVAWQVERAPRKITGVARIEVPMAPPTPEVVSDPESDGGRSREEAINALRQNRMNARDRSRSLNPGQGSREFRMNDPARQWRED